MKSDRPAHVQHLTLLAKPGLAVLALAVILGGRITAPTATQSQPSSTQSRLIVTQPHPTVPLPPGVSGPKDGVGDSPVMPE